MDINHIEKAIEILNAGLNSYPNYAAAHLLLGKAYTLLGQFAQALISVKSGCDLIRSPLTYEFYRNEIDSTKKQRSMFESSARTSFFDFADVTTTPASPVPVISVDKFNEEFEDDKPVINIDDRLEDLAKKISSARRSELPKDVNYEFSGNNNFGESNMIVSETLAKIYITQGELNEAIEVYKKLIHKNPSKTEYYSQKISEIQSQLE
jgi:tetratricopeptide (TPR) repeat protein